MFDVHLSHEIEHCSGQRLQVTSTVRNDLHIRVISKWHLLGVRSTRFITELQTIYSAWKNNEGK